MAKAQAKVDGRSPGLSPDRPRPSRATLVHGLACMDSGDRWAAAGDRNRALSYYGRALDDYLAEGLLLLAAAVARRMIEKYPDVVRARMTLAVLSLAEGLRMLEPASLRSTCSELEAYVHAAHAAGQDRVAHRQLTRLAIATESDAVRERISDLLLLLDPPSEAGAIEPPDDGSADPGQRARWIDVLITSPIA